MRTMQFTEENISEILRLLAGILHAGNIEFMTAGGAQVSSKSGQRVLHVLHCVSYLFAVAPDWNKSSVSRPDVTVATL